MKALYTETFIFKDNSVHKLRPLKKISISCRLHFM